MATARNDDPKPCRQGLGSVRMCACLGVSLLIETSCRGACPAGSIPKEDQCVAHVCSVLGPTKPDLKGIDRMTRVDVPGQECFWMDQTEVTVQKFNLWRRNPSQHPVGWNPELCAAWKGSGNAAPGNAGSCAVSATACGGASSGDAAMNDVASPLEPVRCVDWCEADAFCRWMGERLCFDAPTTNIEWLRGSPVREWYVACTNNGASAYPWGNTAEAGHCNVFDSDGASPCGPRQVALEASCGSPNGIVDQIGNVAEWVFGCGGTPTGCLVAGGAYDPLASGVDPQLLGTCSGADVVRSPDTRAPDIGFRCCADLTRDEHDQVNANR